VEIKVNINRRQSNRLESMKIALGVNSISEVIERAVDLLERSLEEIEGGNHICSANENRGIEKVFDIVEEKNEK
jgi:hypothetical protein